MDRLVAYGTLKDSPAFKPLGPITLEGTLYDLGMFPGAVDINNSDHTFEAFVYAIDPSWWKHLDIYEGVASGLYRREQIDTPYGDAYIYVFNREVYNNPPIINKWR